MLRFFTFLFFLFLSLTALANASPAFKKFTQSLEKKDWQLAKNTTKELNNPELKNLVTWLKLVTEDKVDFYEITNFIKQNPNWPKQNLLLQKAEENISNAKEQDILSWFKKHPVKTNIGKKKYLQIIANYPEELELFKKLWITVIFTKDEEASFFKNYGKNLKLDDYQKKIDYMIFNNQIDQAIDLISYLPKNLQSSYQVRINIRKNKITTASSKDIGILYELARINNNEQSEENLIKILQTSSKIKSEYQNYFWPFKVKLLRKLIAKKDYNTAYLFAVTHGNDIDDKDYVEAEWLSGWIALRFLEKPKDAITHFQNFYSKVKLPISLARGSYWLGRAYEKLNDLNQSNIWYKKAAKYHTSFYGQLAICKIDKCQIELELDSYEEPKSVLLLRQNRLVNAGLTLKQTKYQHFIQEFLKKAIDHSNDYGEIALITKLGFQFNQYHMSVETSKHASYKDIHILDSAYPIHKSIHSDHNLNQALVLALIRQESVFNHQAVSTAGAMGLMQIMPHVAKETALKLKLKFNKGKLFDPKFNSQLGVAHLNKLMNYYNNSNILAIAAYNAGERNVNQWIELHGDPRKMKNLEQIIDWMEKISFYETRNYVQRVLEGKSVYQLLINKQNKLSIISDILLPTKTE